MRTEFRHHPGRRVGSLVAVAFLAFSFLLFSGSAASAAAKCSIGSAKNADGTADLTGYLQCQFPAVAPNPAAPGSDVTIKAGGFKPASTVTISLECPGSSAIVLGTTVADDAGNVLTTNTIPADAPTGACSVTLTGVDPNDEPLTVVLAVTVSASATVSDLPVTGSDVGQYLGLGVALIALGGAAVWGTRRERSKRVA